VGRDGGSGHDLNNGIPVLSILGAVGIGSVAFERGAKFPRAYGADMKRMKTTHWAATAAVTSLALATTGCAENDSTIYVRQMQAETRDAECIVNSDPGSLTDSVGIYDPLCQFDDQGNITANCSTSPYRGFPLVGNGMVSRGDEDLLRAESNSVQLYGIEREVILPGGGLVTAEIGTADASFSAVAGFVEVSSPTNPGFGLTDAVLLTRDEAVGALQAAGGDTNVLVRFKLLGETLGGKDVETGIFDYPVEIRNRPGRFRSCDSIDLTEEIDEADVPCRLNQGGGVGFTDPRFDPSQNFCR